MSLPPGTSCLVTGGAGFIGSHVTERLVALGCRVRVVDDLSTGSLVNLSSVDREIDFIQGDVRDPEVYARAVAGVEVVFHLAALGSVPRSMKDPWGTHDVNVNGTVRLLEACVAAGVRRVVYSSSSSVYGDTPTLPKTEAVEPLPRSPYAASKLAGEQYTLAWARAGLIEAVALRYFNVFGPRQSPFSTYAAVIPLFLSAAANHTAAQLYGDGEQTRDFTYVDNVVEANLLAATRPASVVSGQVANVGAGARTSLRELLHLVERVAGRPIEVSELPPRGGDVRDSLAGLIRARDVLGYKPMVPLEDGLRRTWRWFASSLVRPSHGPAPVAATA